MEATVRGRMSVPFHHSTIPNILLNASLVLCFITLLDDSHGLGPSLQEGGYRLTSFRQRESLFTSCAWIRGMNANRYTLTEIRLK